MKKKLIKNYSLNNFNDSYLLVKFPKYIVTNTDYKKLLILNNNLNKVRTIKKPFTESSIHYTYYHNNSEQVLFQLDDDEGTILFFNIKTYKFNIIKSPLLESIYPSSRYTWTDNTFCVTGTHAESNEQLLLIIDTETFSVQCKPISKILSVSPALENILILADQYKGCWTNSHKSLFILLDYDNDKTIKIINFKNKLLRIISIANELHKELYGKTGRLRAERIPHEIRYQDGWFIIIWEKKIVVVSPEDNRITLYPKETFMFMNARFTKTAETSADLVLLTSDYSCKESSELQLYHVEDE